MFTVKVLSMKEKSKQLFWFRIKFCFFYKTSTKIIRLLQYVLLCPKRCSHLYNKSEVTLTDFEKNSPLSMFIDFLNFFHPPLLVYCSYTLVFFPKNPTLHIYSNLHFYLFCNFWTTSTFIPTSTVIREMRAAWK